MFTPKRLPKFQPSGDWNKDGPLLHKWIQDYFLSLEQVGALAITEASLDGSPVGASDADTGKFTTLEVTTSSTFPSSSASATVTAGSGTFTTVAGAVARQRVGNREHFTAAVTITTNGTAATDVRVAMPTAANGAVGFGGWRTGGIGLAATMAASSSTLVITDYDGTYPGADSRVLLISGSYRV